MIILSLKGKRSLLLFLLEFFHESSWKQLSEWRLQPLVQILATSSVLSSILVSFSSWMGPILRFPKGTYSSISDWILRKLLFYYIPECILSILPVIDHPPNCFTAILYDFQRDIHLHSYTMFSSSLLFFSGLYVYFCCCSMHLLKVSY